MSMKDPHWSWYCHTGKLSATRPLDRRRLDSARIGIYQKEIRRHDNRHCQLEDKLASAYRRRYNLLERYLAYSILPIAHCSQIPSEPLFKELYDEISIITNSSNFVLIVK